MKTALTIATVHYLGFFRDLSCAVCVNCEVPLTCSTVKHYMSSKLVLGSLERHFILDVIGFDYFLFSDMRRDVQEIFRNTPHGKQVMMFSATLSKEIRPVCKKFMQDVIHLQYLPFIT